MPAYNVFFFSALFFLLGVGLGSLGFTIWLVFFCALSVGAFCLILWSNGQDKKFLWIGLLGFVMILGMSYYRFDDARFRAVALPFEKQISSRGIIVDDPDLKNGRQEIIVALQNFHGAQVLARLPAYPQFEYGDEIKIDGKIQAADGSYTRYLEKERVHGTMSFPKIERLASGNGSRVRAALISIRHAITGSFEKLLPPEEAAFLTGLTLGGTGGFSQEFKKAMSTSGTTHLVALSGYNITIVVWVTLGIFAYFLSRRAAFLATFLVLIGFVLMAGAEASVVRAAIMGVLILIAREAGRIYDFRNAIIFAALIMVLVNPKVLTFDVGFQLSFLALLGIIYVRPAFLKLLKIEDHSESILSWKDNLITTFSAQLAVAPVLISCFGSVSLTSIIANMLVLPVVPVTMGVGFIIAALSFISYHAALVLSWLAMVLLWFKIGVIELFAKYAIPFSMRGSVVTVATYYTAIAAFVALMSRKKTQRT